VVGGGRDRLFGGAGPDQLLGKGGGDTITGWSGMDVLRSGSLARRVTDGDDTIYAQDGEVDEVHAGGGPGGAYGGTHTCYVDGIDDRQGCEIVHSTSR
jgi:hypothetical protein